MHLLIFLTESELMLTEVTTCTEWGFLAISKTFRY